MTTPTIPIICGPTASGKTNLAIAASKVLAVEIINADSRQVYKYFNIGTNKGKVIHRKTTQLIDGYTIPQVSLGGSTLGWLFDFLEPDEDFNVSNFQSITVQLIEEILERDVIPVIVGGTGLYIDSLVKNYNLDSQPNTKLRKELANYSVKQLHEILELEGFNIEELNNSDKNNPFRLIRIIEKIKGGVLDNKKNYSTKYQFKLFYPEINKTEHNKIIEDRVDQLFDEGLINEVETLLQKGYRDTRPMQGIGYKEIVDFLDGNQSFEATKELVKTSHKRYAKRQRTWFEGKGRGYELIKINEDSLIKHLKNL